MDIRVVAAFSHDGAPTRVRDRGSGRRQPDGKFPSAERRLTHDAASRHRPHEVLTHREPEPGPLPTRFGGEERLEDPFTQLGRHPWPGVQDLDPHPPTLGRTTDPDGA